MSIPSAPPAGPAAASLGLPAQTRVPRVIATAWAVAASCLATVAADAAAPPVRFTHYSTEDHLSQSSVSAIVQDPHGFVWIGTQDGLNRFDGYEFVRHGAGPLESGQLADANVTTLAAGPGGLLWIGTLTGGLHVLESPSGRVLHCDVEGSDSPSLVNDVLVVAEDTAWVATAEGLFAASRAAPGRCVLAPLPPPEGRVTVLAAATDGSVWAGFADGSLWKLDREGRRLQRAPWRSGSPIVALLPSPTGMWVGPDDAEVVQLDAAGNLRQRHALPEVQGRSPRIRGLTLDPDGRLWVTGIDVGLRFLDGDSSAAWRAAPADALSLASNDTTVSLVDHSGTLWIGHRAHGLDALPLAGRRFLHFRHSSIDARSLSHDMVTSFSPAGDPGRVWVGTDGGGLNLLDLEAGTVERREHDPADPRTLSSDRVWALHRDGQQRLWIGTWGGGVDVSLDGGSTFQRLSSHAPGARPEGRIVLAIAEEPDGTLWFATGDAGVSRLSPLSQRFESFRHDPLDPGSLSDDNATTVLVDRDGTVWVGTWSAGLNRLDPASGRVRRFRREAGKPDSLPHDTVRSMAEDGSGQLWIGTAGGLARYDAEREAFERVSPDVGLPPGTIYGILPAPDGSLWLSSNRGLVRFDPAAGSVRAFEPEDGLQGHEFNGNAALATPDGWLLFGGIQGLNAFRPEQLQPNPVPPKVVVTRARSNGQSLDSPPPGGQLVLPYEDNTIDLRFSALHYASPSRNRYAYRLLGLEESWRETDASSRAVTYSELPPGRYRFEVRAANSDGVWSEDPAILDLLVTPPWWRTSWALALWILLAALLLAATVQSRTLALRRRAEALREQVRTSTRRIEEQKGTIERQAQDLRAMLDSKNRLFARISHELRTPLTLILSPTGQALASRRDTLGRTQLESIHRNARRLHALIDRLLDLARLSTERAMPLSCQPLSTVLGLIASSFDTLARDADVRLQLDIDGDYWVHATREGLEAILCNLISNAIKFTPPGGEVRVRLGAVDGSVVMQVRDTGPGVDPQDRERIFEPFERGASRVPGTGIGLAIVRDTARTFGGDVQLLAGGPGAVFELRIPAADAPPDAEEARRLTLSLGTLKSPEAGDEISSSPVREPSAAGADPDRPVVLLVEDHSELRDYLAQLLSPSYACLMAGSAEEGLALAREAVPDLLITDLMLPGADGYALTQWVKSDTLTSHVPVIMLTARDAVDSRIRAREERADEYLTKPFDAQELRLAVRNMIDSREILRRQVARQMESQSGPPAPASPGPASVPLGVRDQRFLERLATIVGERHTDPEFSIAALADAMAMSERQLQRKLRALADMRPAEYLRDFRLQAAARHLAAGSAAGTAASMAGFSTQAHFGLCFRARYGMTPGEYSRRHQHPSPAHPSP